MTITEPNVVATGRYPAGRIAELLGVDRKTLWRYTDEGLIKFGTLVREDIPIYTNRYISTTYNNK